MHICTICIYVYICIYVHCANSTAPAGGVFSLVFLVYSQCLCAIRINAGLNGLFAYAVATMSRLLKIISLFCKRAL